MSLQRCVRVCVRGEGDSHRAEPREEFTRSPRAFLFVLLIPGRKLPSDSSPPHPHTRRFPSHAQRRPSYPLSPGQLPSWDADLPRIIKRLYNQQNPNSICYSVTSRQTQQQCHGTDTEAPRSLPRPQISREPRRIPWLCRAQSARPRPERGRHRRTPREKRCRTGASRGGEGYQTEKEQKPQQIYLKPRRCKGWQSCPSESSASYNCGWKAIFKNRRRE